MATAAALSRTRSAVVLAPYSRRSSAYRSIGWPVRVQSERFLLVGQLLDLGPWWNVWKWNDGRSGVVCVAAEQVHLPEILVPLQPVAMIAGAIDRGEEAGANDVERLAQRGCFVLPTSESHAPAFTSASKTRLLVRRSEDRALRTRRAAKESVLRVVTVHREWLESLLRPGL